jgi:hypothetical protein
LFRGCLKIKDYENGASVLNLVVRKNYKIMQTQYELLTDTQWLNIPEYLPIERRRKYDLRNVDDGIFWFLRIGSQWRNLPKKFPLCQSVYDMCSFFVFIPMLVATKEK